MNVSVAKLVFAMSVVLVASAAHARDKEKAKLIENSSYIDADNNTLVNPVSRTVDYPPEGISLGQGWDSLRDGKVQGRCIEFGVENAGGQVARVQTLRVFDSDSLRRSIDLSYSASLSAKFDVGNASASVKGSFVENSEVNTQYLSLLVKGDIKNGVSFVTPASTKGGVIELTAFAADLLKKGDNGVTFTKYCGDSFVSTIERGAALYALYQYSEKATSASEASTLAISVEGGYMGYSGSASTSLKETKDVASKNERTGLKYLHIAHRGLRLPADEQSIAGSLASLGSAPELADAQPYRIQLQRYDSLPAWPGAKLGTGPATREALVAFYYRLSDLLVTVTDIERNPDRYNLTKNPDIISAATLRGLLEKRLAEASTLLAACEAARKSTGTDARQRAMASCSTQAGDISFSDYPLRALMPIETRRFRRAPATEQRRNQLQATIDKLTATRNTHKVVPAFGLTCKEAPQDDTCRALKRQIDQATTERDVYLANRESLDIADSRYAYWVEAISYARADDGLINGYLSVSELAMYKREIYCQYGIAPDSAGCPKISLSKVLADGNVVKKVKTLAVENVSGLQLDDVQRNLLKFVANVAGDKPHYFELIDPVYTETEPEPRKKLLTLTGKVVITYYDSDKAMYEALLTVP